MTPTHILVPIEWVDDLIESYRKIPSWAWDDGDVQGMKILNQIKDLPKVDLSEEGIQNIVGSKSLGYNGFERSAYEDGYKDCAKDLLNTKP